MLASAILWLKQLQDFVQKNISRTPAVDSLNTAC